MKVIVLNADFSPINVTSLKRGYKLVYMGKAEVLDTYDEYMVVTKRILRPRIIRLLTFVRLPYRYLIPSRHNIYKRDGYTCVYCNSRDHLTLDHVLPKSRGGCDTWENMVTCCSKCNRKKDNRTPEEAGFKMYKRPFAPTLSHLLDFDSREFINKIMARAYSE